MTTSSFGKGPDNVCLSEDLLFEKWKTSNTSDFCQLINSCELQSNDTEKQIRFFLKNIFVADAEQLAPHIFSNRQNHKIKIAFYCGYLTVGGADRVLTLLANHLTNLGYQVYVITLNQPGINCADVYPFSDNIIRIRIDFDHTWMDRLVALAQILGINVWVSNNKIENLSLATLPVKFKNANIRYVQSDHYSFFFPLSRPETYELYAEGMKYYEQCSAVIACNSFIANCYKCFIDNVATMHNPVSYRSDEISRGSYDNNTTILSVGRFNDSIKRFDRTLLVFAEVLKINPDARLVVVGRVDKNVRIPATNFETIGDMIGRLGFAAEQLLLLGEQEDVRPFYRDASVLMMTSENEAFGMVLVEAGVFGIPSVLFEIPGLDDVIIDKLNGFLIEQDDIQGMARTISQLLSDETLRSEVGSNAINKVDIFCIDKIGSKWDNLFRLLVETDNQLVINSVLDSEFNVNPDDWKQVGKKIVREFDKHLAMVLKFYSKPLIQRMNNGMLRRLSVKYSMAHGLRQDIKRLRSDIAKLQNDRQRLENENSKLLNDVAGLEADINAMKIQYCSLENTRPVRLARFVKRMIGRS